MQVFSGVPPRCGQMPCALAVGNFDGVHRGHQALLAQLRADARSRGLAVAVMLFEPQPKEYFLGSQAPARIFTLRDKLEALRDERVDRVHVQRFDARLASMPPDRFVRELVVERAGARVLAAGRDFRYGAGAAGNLATLRAQGPSLGLDVVSFDDVLADAQRISSSWLRLKLAQGDFAGAAELLGRPYALSGRVVRGRQLGRQWGFPTLNLRLDVPRPALQGIFEVWVEGLESQALAGIASLGTRPTVDDSGVFKLEVHLLNFKREVYGARVRVRFLHKQRDEAQFNDTTTLIAQMQRDLAQAQRFFSGRAIPTV